MKYFTKVAILFGLCMSFNLSAMAEEVFQPKPAFVDMTPERMMSFVNLVIVEDNINIPEEIKKHGYPMVLGMMSFGTVTKTAEAKDLHGFNQLPTECRLTPVGYAKCWMEYNNVPADLTIEQFFQIHDNRGLYHLTPGFISMFGSKDAVMAVAKPETSTATEVVVKPTSKPETPVEFLATVKFREDAKRVEELQKQVASLKAVAGNSQETKMAIKELEGKLSGLLENINLLTESQDVLRDDYKEFLELSKKLEETIGSNKVAVNELFANLSGRVDEVEKKANIFEGKLFSHTVWLSGLSLAIFALFIFFLMNKAGFKALFTKLSGRVDEVEEQIEVMQARMLDLEPEDAKLISKANIRNLAIGKSVSILVPIQLGNDVASFPFIVERIDNKKIKINIKRKEDSKQDSHIVDDRTGLVSLLSKAITEGRFSLPDSIEEAA